VSDLRKAALGWDEVNNMLILSYRNPDLIGDYNNCQLLFDFEHRRWIYYWRLKANCFCTLYDSSNYNKVWFGCSNDGTIQEMNYGNCDKLYGAESRPIWMPFSPIPPGAEAGVWGGPGVSGSRWTSGEQISSEVWLKEEDFGTPFVNKSLQWIFADITPLPENQLEISVWDRGDFFLTSYIPEFTQLSGFDIAKFDIARFDVNTCESIVYQWPETTEARIFQLRFRFPLSSPPSLDISGVTGLNDIVFSGKYNGTTTKNYIILIDSVGTPDTFAWSDDGGNTWKETGVIITGNEKDLSDGIKVKFNFTTGHTLNDRWIYTVSISRQTGGRWKLKYLTLAYRNLNYQVPTSTMGV